MTCQATWGIRLLSLLTTWERRWAGYQSRAPKGKPHLAACCCSRCTYLRVTLIRGLRTGPEVIACSRKRAVVVYSCVVPKMLLQVCP